ncbi:hypothetical protein MKW94_004413 [Papaver nudicaule]|uniref:Uncharacterized protein n=1 Tax=Papaver nudicaule TaxID=74823 RepID=A0AA42B5H3_PAPNU|nr:hypothetical protein [Papaver nudicaule]
MSRRVLNKMIQVRKNISTPLSDLGNFKNEFHTLGSTNKLINGQIQHRQVGIYPPYQNIATRCFEATPLEKAKKSAVKGNTLKQMFEANRAVFWHMNLGMEEILKDYVHQEVTREWVSVYLRVFSIIVMKDLVLALV